MENIHTSGLFFYFSQSHMFSVVIALVTPDSRSRESAGMFVVASSFDVN